MSDRAAQVTPGSSRRRGAHASDDMRSAPAFTASALTASAAGGGWLLDHFEVVPASAGVVAAGVLTGGLLWWSAARSLSARRGMARAERVRAEREAALRALGEVFVAVEEGMRSVRWAAEQAEKGEAHTDFPPPAVRPRTADVGLEAVNAVKTAFEESWQAVMKAATHQQRELNAEAELAGIFKSVAPRLQSLVNRGIAAISEVEKNIEDPELLDAVFQVDHLLTQIRRDAESLAVLGGSAPSRDSDPVLVVTAVRRAVGEIPQYARVRVGQSDQRAALPGYVSPNLVHLLAALMENATDFSRDKVEVFIHQAGPGIAIEVLDRGTGMSQQKRETLNRLLAAPESEDPRPRLREGKFGLLVAARLAKRHRITIELGPNIIGGTRAIVIIPADLLVSPNVRPGRRPTPAPRLSAPAGPVRQSPVAPHPQVTAQPPQSSPRASGTGPAPIVQGGKRPLPRRSGAENRLPPVVQQAPSGHATSDLMAAFQSRTPEHGPAAPPDA